MELQTIVEQSELPNYHTSLLLIQCIFEEQLFAKQENNVVKTLIKYARETIHISLIDLQKKRDETKASSPGT